MEKKKLWIFVAIAYGVSALMSIFLLLGRQRGIDTSMVVQTQMLYPACGVILGKLICRKEGEKLPVAAYITVLLTTAVSMIVSALSVLMQKYIITYEGINYSLWTVYGQYVVFFGTVVAYILFWICGKEKRENAGMSHKNIKSGIACVALFTVLYFVMGFVSGYLYDLVTHTNQSIDMTIKALTSSKTLGLVATLPFTFLTSWVIFYGEEYGWRYFLQPILQDKFGKRKGIFILGIVWALWHTNIVFWYYTVDHGFEKLLQQFIICLAYGIFFGYAYMKTGNIWVVVIMHFLNNNLSVVLAGGTADALQNQQVSWLMLPICAVSFLVFIVFIFAPIYSSDEKIANTIPNTYNC